MTGYKFIQLTLSLVPFVYADCIVEDKSTKDYASCVFPFTFNYKDSNGTRVNQTFYGCTTNLDPDDKPWCSTKVDSNGIHQHGHWGHCETDFADCNNVIVPRLADKLIGKRKLELAISSPSVYRIWFLLQRTKGFFQVNIVPALIGIIVHGTSKVCRKSTDLEIQQ